MLKKGNLFSGLMAVFFLFTVILGFEATANAASPAEFYKGQTVKIVLPSKPGGTLDTISRLLATYLPQITGANWVVINEPAGGGFVATNTFYNETKPDGLTLHGNSHGKFWPPYLMGEKEVKYDITKFEYIGGTKGGPICFDTYAKGPYTTVEALKGGKNLKFAGRQPNSLLSLGVLLSIDTLNIDAKLIAGFKGTSDVKFSILQKETHGTVLSGESTFDSEKNEELKCLFILSDERDENYKDWPAITEVAKLSPKQERMLGAIFADGKAYMVPPGTPADRKQFLKDSFAKVFADKAFQRQVEKVAGEWLGTNTGEQLHKMAEKIKNSKGDMATFDELIKKYVK